MTAVRVTSVGVAHPAYRFRQEDSSEAAAAFQLDVRKVNALTKHSQIDSRAMVLPPLDLAALGSIEARNDYYRRVAPGLATEAVANAVCGRALDDLGCLVTSSCTGYTSPGWAIDLIEHFRLPATTVRVPLTESGCAGGAVALARAADYLRSRPGQSSLAVSTELCSLTFHPPFDDANFLAALIFGDGAGAALLETGDGLGLEVVDSLTYLIPGSQSALGFDLTDQGFHPVLSRELADLIAGPTATAVAELLRPHGLGTADIDGWLIHPGGSRILEILEARLDIPQRQTRWSWDSLREYGNTSSAAVFDVLARYLAEPASAPSWAVLAAFGPGVSIELTLLRRQ